MARSPPAAADHHLLCPACGRASPPPPAYDQIAVAPDDQETLDCLKHPRRILNHSDFQTMSYIIFGSITAALVAGRPLLLDLKLKLRCKLMLIIANPALPREGDSLRRVMKQLDDYDLLDVFHTLAPDVPVWIPATDVGPDLDFCYTDCIYLCAFDQVREFQRRLQHLFADRPPEFQKPSTYRTYFVSSDKADVVRWHEQLPSTIKILYTPSPGWKLPSLTAGPFTRDDQYLGYPVSAGAAKAKALAAAAARKAASDAHNAAVAQKVAAAAQKVAAAAQKVAANTTKAAAAASVAYTTKAAAAASVKASPKQHNEPSPLLLKLFCIKADE